jgi:hypothetical protein
MGQSRTPAAEDGERERRPQGGKDTRRHPEQRGRTGFRRVVFPDRRARHRLDRAVRGTRIGRRLGHAPMVGGGDRLSPTYLGGRR